MCIAPPAAPNGAAPSREIMVFVTIILIIAVLLAALAGYAIGVRGRAGHFLPEEPQRFRAGARRAGGAHARRGNGKRVR